MPYSFGMTDLSENIFFKPCSIFSFLFQLIVEYLMKIFSLSSKFIKSPIFYYLQHIYQSTKSFDEQTSISHCSCVVTHGDDITMGVAMETYNGVVTMDI